MTVQKKVFTDMMAIVSSNDIKPAPEYKLLLNIGACLDVPTGIYHKTRSGRYYLNGGLGYTTGIIAKGNSFKSALANYMGATAAYRIYENIGATVFTIYDTEVTMHRSTVQNTLNTVFTAHGLKPEEFPDWWEDGMAVLTDATQYSGNKFVKMMDERLLKKVDNNILIDTPLVKADGTTFQVYWPWISEVDSLTDWRSDRIEKKEEENEIGDSGGNMIYMTGGLDKYRYLGTLNQNCAKYSNWMILTAQLSKKHQLGNGYTSGDGKDLAAMGQDEKVTGASSKFAYMATNSWKVSSNKPLDQLISGNKKAPRYPLNSSETSEDNKDLFTVDLRMVRSKSGAAFTEETMVVSQKFGVQPTLTEFYRLDVTLKKKYGMLGNDRSYQMVLLPKVNLSRTTIRTKIDENSQLRRAINITSELSQIYRYHRERYKHLYMTPEELYEKLNALGYDWDKILNTKGYYSVGEDMKNEPTSTLTLLAMAKEEFVDNKLKKDKQVDKKSKPKAKK